MQNWVFYSKSIGLPQAQEIYNKQSENKQLKVDSSSATMKARQWNTIFNVKKRK